MDRKVLGILVSNAKWDICHWINHNLANIKFAKITPSMEMRFFESYGNSPPINWRGGTGSRKSSLDRCGHARLVLFSGHEADPLTM